MNDSVETELTSESYPQSLVNTTLEALQEWNTFIVQRIYTTLKNVELLIYF